MSQSESIYAAQDRHTLLSWLKSKCQYSEGIFDDPGYSERYKGYFSHYFYDDTYVTGDIDYELNIGHYEYVYEDEDDLSSIDEQIIPYVDFVPSGLTHDEITRLADSYPLEYRDRAEEISSRTGIVILPGSNHSNANYIYKRIREHIDDIPAFSVPFVNDYHKAFRPSYKKATLTLSKTNVYNFVYSVSAINHTYQISMNLLNLDRILAENAFERSDYNKIGCSNYNNFDDLETESTASTTTTETNESFNTHKSKSKVLQESKTKRTSNMSYGELNRIDRAMTKLYSEIQRYIECVQVIWDDVFVPFLISNNCNTMRYLFDTDYRIFLDYMTNQTPFKVMSTSMSRLRARQIYLTRHLT
jgi:hypothetical protein